MTIDLEAIKARIEASTHGPWVFDLDPLADTVEYFVAREFEFFGAQIEGVASGAIEEDASFIAHAREDVPALVAAVERALKVHRKSSIGNGCIECTRLTDHTIVGYPCDTAKALGVES